MVKTHNKLMSQEDSDTFNESWFLDQNFPVSEQLPRYLEVQIESFTEDSKNKVRMMINGMSCGDPLTDNSYVDDGYRFHDIFHLACAAMLGWSPVTRKLLGRKRKSVPSIDEVEDGGRATAIEEGICALVFSYAADHDFLQTATSIDGSILRIIKGMTRGLEVSVRTSEEWQTMILSTYEMWTVLKKNSANKLHLDLNRRTIICL